MPEAKRETSWLLIVATALVGFEGLPIVTVWPFLVLFIVIGLSMPGGRIDTLDVAVLFYPATWAVTVALACHLRMTKRYGLALACTLIPLTHVALTVAWILVAAG
jgi:hypothetical protein